MNVEDVNRLIVSDKNRVHGSYNRYPVRFVFLDLSTSSQDDILKLIGNDYDVDFLELSQYLLDDDGWITKTKLMNIVKGCNKTKDTFIVGLSEWLRFLSNNDLESVLLSLVGDIENDISDEIFANRRIYFICFSMKDYIFKVLNEKFHRFDVYNPFINPDFHYERDLVTIYFGDIKWGDTSVGNDIYNSKEWLELWKKSGNINFKKPVICHSKTLFDWYNDIYPENAFQIEHLKNIKDVLNKVYHKSMLIDYEKCDENHWKFLSEYAIKNSIDNLYELLTSVFNISKIDEFSLVEKLINTNNNDNYRWLLYKSIIKLYPDSYLFKVFESINIVSSEEIIKMTFLYDVNSKEEAEERKRLFDVYKSSSGFEVPEADLAEKYNKEIRRYINVSIFGEFDLSDFNLTNSSKDLSQLKLLRQGLRDFYTKYFKTQYTGYSQTERQIVVSLYANDIITRSEVKELYDDFYSYISYDDINVNNPLKEYFSEYIESKVHNKDSEKLQEFIEKYNKNEESFYTWYYSMNKPESLVNSMTQSGNKYVIDCLGAEYSCYIKRILESYEYKVKIDFGAVHLPSITSVNKPYYEKNFEIKKWFLEFDENVIHGEYYKTSRNITKALDYIKNIIKRIVDKENGNSFCITSDHGSTARPRWTVAPKMYDFSDSDHEGRCKKIKSTEQRYNSNENYIVYSEPGYENQWLVTLKDISLYNRPKYENHGGASIEEVVVPVIYAYKNDSIIYTVNALKLSVTGLDRTVEFSILPLPKTVVFTEENGSAHSMSFNGKTWEGHVDFAVNQEIKLNVDGQVESFRIKAISSMNQEEDDGFDD